ncbi:MAG: toxic anion resistance protein [Candidatus Competibacteraceae bacterium]|uniref:Toxic anion resistance family protein n=1 Tax=Candidatus Contendobacter odensis Run_B_J11 TaxID=1400861 RepID=A0A7U7GFS2_9GAMM|nr:toxic anion resistance protein [Candidatus Contendobacter odensis]MBK8536230.1 toxic anion resistance protein [Candidatus Competibacteraceae bacterium]MBK8751383.1 toxic anion resistance protein [Candidatus Competibacteraceae bacterium]CDH47338.1 Toxic anion resistance family protein [Candidatus Contendobacter odensis Run_B_J11]
MSAIELTPPEQTVIEPLTPPAPVAAVAPDKAHSMVKLEPGTLTSLNAKVQEFVSAVLTLHPQSDEFKNKVANIHNLGSAEIRSAASVSNRMLQRPTQALSSGLFDDGAPIARTLTDLRKTVEDLDPGRQGDLFAPKKLFGIIPFGNRLRDYFLQYQSAQSHINAILQALYNGQDELRKDNAAIEQEKANLWAMMQKLEQYVYVGKQLDTELEGRIGQIEAESQEKARIIKEEMLFYLRQKVQDLLTQLAVSIQGYLALDMIRKNNLELIKGVDRATTTTVSALRTAVIVAQALANQKLVLDQINALNTTTGNLIESTSAMLKQQSGQIQQQAVSATISLDKLKTAFSNIYQTMDMMADYKIKALDNMRQTVEVLSTEVDKAKKYVTQAREAETIMVSSTSATTDLVL